MLDGPKGIVLGKTEKFKEKSTDESNLLKLQPLHPLPGLRSLHCHQTEPLS
jgi:hypothetical protein